MPDRVGPVFDPELTSVEGMEGIGDVAGGEDTGDAGLESLVGRDPVLDTDAGSFRECAPRRNPDSDDDRLALDRPSASEPHPLHPAVTLDRFKGCIRVKDDTVVAVDLGVDLADLESEDVLKRDLGTLDYFDVETLLAG